MYHRLLIFCTKLYIGMMYRGMHFQIHRTSTSCLPRSWSFSNTVLLYNIFCHIILSNYLTQSTDILQEALYSYHVSWYAFSDSSDIYFLFTKNLEFFIYSTHIHFFRNIILSNYWWQATDILHEALYRYGVLWDAFSDSSDIYFLFAENLEFL